MLITGFPERTQAGKFPFSHGLSKSAHFNHVLSGRKQELMEVSHSQLANASLYKYAGVHLSMYIHGN